jgi:hypothetical protein
MHMWACTNTRECAHKHIHVHAHIHITHTQYSSVSTSTCHPISHLQTRQILHGVKKSRNTTDLVHVKMAAVWQLHLQTTFLHNDITFTWQPSRSFWGNWINICYLCDKTTFKVVNTSSHACSLAGIWLLFLSLSKHTIAENLQKKWHSNMKLKSTHLHKNTKGKDSSVTFSKCTASTLHIGNNVQWISYLWVFSNSPAVGKQETETDSKVTFLCKRDFSSICNI